MLDWMLIVGAIHRQLDTHHSPIQLHLHTQTLFEQTKKSSIRCHKLHHFLITQNKVMNNQVKKVQHVQRNKHKQSNSIFRHTKLIHVCYFPNSLNFSYLWDIHLVIAIGRGWSVFPCCMCCSACIAVNHGRVKYPG